MNDTAWSGIHSMVWTALFKRCGRCDVLMPNLQVISELCVHSRDALRDIIIPPSLRQLTIKYSSHGYIEDEVILESYFEKIATTASGITHLTIRTSEGQCITSTCLTPFQKLSALQVLDVGQNVLNLGMLYWLADLPSLHTLKGTIDLQCETEDEDEIDFFDVDAFKQLKHLDVRGIPIELYIFLRDTVPSALESLAFEPIEPVSPSHLTHHLQQCVQIITEYREYTLLEFALRYPHEIKHPQNYTLLDFAARPVLDIHTLQRVTFDFQDLPSVTNDDLVWMIDAWPYLSALHIPRRRTHYSMPSRPTCSSLITFATRCPRLTDLTLPDVVDDKFPPCDDAPYANHPLHTLEVHLERHSAWEAQAVFVDRLFYCVTFRDVREDDTFSYPRTPVKWKYAQLRRHLRLMQEGRRERERLQMLPRTAPAAGRASALV